MENSKEIVDRTCFTAQYFGQKVLSFNEILSGKHLDRFYNLEPLQLKSLENINDYDDDYNELMDILETHMPEHFINANIHNESFSINIFKSYMALDYLRSKGYLLPFRNYSADQIISMGWAKIK